MSKVEFKNETITLFNFAKSQISDPNISTQFENMVSNYFNKWENKYNDKITNINEKLKKNKTNIDKIYNMLKSSVCYDEKLLEPTQVNNIDEGKTYIQYYEGLIKSSNKNIRFYHYKIGELLSKLQTEYRSNNKNFEIMKNQICTYKRSYTYFLIDLYNTCNKFSNLKFTTLHIGILQKYFKDLKNKMECDSSFWNPSTQAATQIKMNN